MKVAGQTTPPLTPKKRARIVSSLIGSVEFYRYLFLTFLTLQNPQLRTGTGPLQVNIYQTEKTPNLLNLPWIGSLGNHDVLGTCGILLLAAMLQHCVISWAYCNAGLKAGIDAQIAYSQENNNWVLPARYYTADVNASAGPSVRIHTAYTSCWVSSVSGMRN